MRCASSFVSLVVYNIIDSHDSNDSTIFQQGPTTVLLMRYNSRWTIEWPEISLHVFIFLQHTWHISLGCCPNCLDINTGTKSQIIMSQIMTSKICLIKFLTYNSNKKTSVFVWQTLAAGVQCRKPFLDLTKVSWVMRSQKLFCLPLWKPTKLYTYPLLFFSSSFQGKLIFSWNILSKIV